MPVSRGTHRCVQGNPFVKRTKSTSALRLFIPVLRKVVEWIHLRSGAGGGKTRGGGGARWAADSRITWLILPVVMCLSQRLSHACVSLLQCNKLQSMRACCVATASSRAWELAAATQQTPKLVQLWSLLQRSKFRSFLAPERESLLRCNSKLWSVRACCWNAPSSGACLLQRSKLRNFLAPERESLLLQRNKL
jgi:hypothetical protein